MRHRSHHHPGDLEYNNPHADRFKGKRPKHSNGFSRIAFVMQGGGGMGAYQFGVLKGLVEGGFEPDWISATSIGAIQAAIFVGNTPDQRIAKLEEFWDRVSLYSPFDIWGHEPMTTDHYNKWSSNSALLLGQPGFFHPRWVSPYFQVAGTPATLSFYDTSPLRQTLVDLIDFELLNKSLTRLSLGTVQISTGHLIYFNNFHYTIAPEHIMASAALPPGFPAVEIGGEYYWDGGIHSNTPLEVIFDAKPATDTLCFVIDCFGGVPFIPTNMAGVDERTKDIKYSTHARRVIKNHMRRQALQAELQKLAKYVSSEQRQEIAELLDLETPHHHTLAHIAYSNRIHRGAAKDYDFSQVIIKKRIDVGHRDAKLVLAESHLWNYPCETEAFRLYEAPNNLVRYLRADD